MKKEIENKKQKHLLIRSFSQLWPLEEAIQEIRNSASAELQLSVLGKFSQVCISTDSEVLKAKKELKQYWRDSLGPTSDFGLFCNPEIGTLFIVGSLVSQFLHDVDGKLLGEMSSGPYGILRGLGATEKDTSNYIRNLNEAYYLLIIRGYDFELEPIEIVLKNFDSLNSI
ncbi:hypothetical protein [Maribacter aestuarii]|uniref:hypothetical protein n=1 Tax=Maribacter aestuarii TaxID=1130723 RepID=UPI00248CBAA5|nr:hypothetical protein [Maribacter aestuarii]